MAYHIPRHLSTVRGVAGGYVGQMGPRAPSNPPKSSGHTEGLRATLRRQREKLRLDPEDVEREIARRLAGELLEQRTTLNLEQLDVQRRLVAEEGGDPDEVTRGSRVSNWETMTREPRIDEFAAWARAVGMRLVVLLEPAESPRQAVFVQPDLADAAATIGQLSPQKAAAAQLIAEAIALMSPGQVRALAEHLNATLSDE